MATGIAAWAAAGFFGVHALFVAFPWLNGALKLVGGLYLVLLGVRLLAGSRRPEPPGNPGADFGPGRFPFWLGLLDNLGNPKAPLFVSSLFAATLPPQPPTALGVMAVGLMFALALAWYVLVARVLTIRHVACTFARARHWIDRAAGLAFMGFGTKLVLDRSA